MGRFNREKYRANIEKFSIENQQRELKEGKHIWEVSQKEEDFEEDNDTEEEDEDEEGHFDESIMKQNSDNLGRKIGANQMAEDLINPKKGFKFFIEQEQMLLERLEKKKKYIQDQYSQLSKDK